MPRAVDVSVADHEGRPVSGLVGTVVATRPADDVRAQRGVLTELPQQPGRYRTLVPLDGAGAWTVRLDASQQSMRFVHTDRLSVPASAAKGPPQ
jgi:nitrogen fixation protein FixH